MSAFKNHLYAKFNHLRVIELKGKNARGIIEWNCLCDCGNLRKVSSAKLTSGRVTSCIHCGYTSEFKDITGEKFNRLTAIEYVGDCKWLFRCSCGEYITVKGADVRNGHTKSCGCFKGDKARAMHSGSNNWNWKGGVTDIYTIIRTCQKYRDWRKACFERDNYTCTVTKAKRKLEVHHKTTVKSIIEKYNLRNLQDVNSCDELWDLDNGVTYSKEYHKEVHRKRS